jgi:adenine-specific DNA methylase
MDEAGAAGATHGRAGNASSAASVNGSGGKVRVHRRDVERRLGEIESEIKTLKADAANYAKRLSPAVESDLKHLEKYAEECKEESRRKLYREEAERRRLNPASYIRGEMLDDAKARLAELRAEENKLKAWLAKKVNQAIDSGA